MELAEVDLAEAALLLERGAWNQVAGPASAGEDRAQANGWRLLVPLGSLLRGRAELGAGRPSEAARELQRAVRQARSVGATGTLTIAAAALDQVSALERLAGKQIGDFLLAGAGGQAEADGDRGQPGDPRLARHSKARPPFDEAAAIGLETAGLRALRAGDYLEATTAFRAAVRTWNAVGLTAWQARAEGFRALALEADGRRAAAGAARRRAAAILKAIGGQDSSTGAVAG
jgi:hypothetical protein